MHVPVMRVPTSSRVHHHGRIIIFIRIRIITHILTGAPGQARLRAGGRPGAGRCRGNYLAGGQTGGSPGRGPGLEEDAYRR